MLPKPQQDSCRVSKGLNEYCYNKHTAANPVTSVAFCSIFTIYLILQQRVSSLEAFQRFVIKTLVAYADTTEKL